MNILEAKHVLRSVGFNLTKQMNEEVDMDWALEHGLGLDPYDSVEIDPEDMPPPEEDEEEPEAEPREGDIYMEIEDALNARECDPKQVANLMSQFVGEIAELVMDKVPPEEIADKLMELSATEAPVSDEIEEAKRVVMRNGYKFVKESKKYAGNHPVFSSKDFQNYLIKECGTDCCADDKKDEDEKCCKKCKKSKSKCKCKK